MLPTMPAPPETRNAPVTVLVDAVELDATNSPVLIVPNVPLVNVLPTPSVPVV